MKKGTLSEAKSRRQLAEELLRKSSAEITSVPSKDETLKLIHELQVKQIELELQNEELMMAKAAEYESASKYVELYNSAPSGYLTLSKEGKILEVNLTGAKMLGKDRRTIKNTRLDEFVSDESKQVLNDFIVRAFRTNDQESCEVNLNTESNQSAYVYLTGFVRKRGKQCLITMVDVTDSKMQFHHASGVNFSPFTRISCYNVNAGCSGCNGNFIFINIFFQGNLFILFQFVRCIHR